jgi:hypothetical protein
MLHRGAPSEGQGLVSIPEFVTGSPRVTYRRLRMAGLTTAQAGNLTAHMSGLRIARSGWTLQEVEGLLFVRSMVDTGRMGS